jgi:hypothetical protein
MHVEKRKAFFIGRTAQPFSTLVAADTSTRRGAAVGSTGVDVLTGPHRILREGVLVLR